MYKKIILFQINVGYFCLVQVGFFWGGGNVQVVNILDLIGDKVFLDTTEFCSCVGKAAIQYINKWAWLYSRKTCL